jgi:hypothetical protein
METGLSLDTALRVRMTYASNAIEGNRLTLAETQVVLQGEVIGGKLLRDHLEAIDHAEAWNAMVHWPHSDEPINGWLLRTLHGLGLRRSQPDNVGQYCAVSVAIEGSSVIPTNPIGGPSAVDNLMTNWRYIEGNSMAVGAEMRAPLMAILLINLWLMRNHYLPALLEPDDRPVSPVLSAPRGTDDHPAWGAHRTGPLPTQF